MHERAHLCHETIYQAIYVIPKSKLRTETIALLRFGLTNVGLAHAGVTGEGKSLT